jgi:hypothetical protein
VLVDTQFITEPGSPNAWGLPDDTTITLRGDPNLRLYEMLKNGDYDKWQATTQDLIESGQHESPGFDGDGLWISTRVWSVFFVA